jgi:Ca2+-binding RTX toxin-like protein
MEDVGSHAFFFSGNLEMFADNLHVDGTFNKGVDGNGYGIEYDKTYYSDFTNLEITNVRHAVSANMLGGNGFNNFHVKFTDSNLDFHGGRDQANIYYVENIAYKAHYLPIVKDGKLTGDINYGFGKTQFELIDYRQDVNAQENTVVWKNVVANGSPNNDGSILDALGAKLAVNMHSNDDILVAGDNGSNINAGFGNDIIFAGKGNDILTGGRNASGSSNMDTFVFDTKSGHDVITDFEVGHDRLIITHSGSILKGVLEVLSSVSQSGNDTVLDFGNGNSITLMNTHTEDINSTNVQLLSDALDLI